MQEPYIKRMGPFYKYANTFKAKLRYTILSKNNLLISPRHAQFISTFVNDICFTIIRERERDRNVTINRARVEHVPCVREFPTNA